jgi:hypothetical protein
MRTQPASAGSRAGCAVEPDRSEADEPGLPPTASSRSLVSGDLDAAGSDAGDAAGGAAGFSDLAGIATSSLSSAGGPPPTGGLVAFGRPVFPGWLGASGDPVAGPSWPAFGASSLGLLGWWASPTLSLSARTASSPGASNPWAAPAGLAGVPGEGATPSGSAVFDSGAGPTGGSLEVVASPLASGWISGGAGWTGSDRGAW